MDYIAIAIAPCIAICLYIFYKDIYNKEPRTHLFISFLLGAAAILPAIGIERTFSQGLIDGSVGAVAVLAFIVVALTEESCKFAGLRLYSYNQKSFDEPLDGIVYSLMISMGFATAENIKYVIEHQQAAGTGLQIGLYRMFTAVPAHATFAVVMGYFVGRAKLEPGKSFGLLITGLFAAVLFHGTYDFLLMLYQFSYVGQEIGEGLLFAGAIISLIVALILSRRLIRHHVVTSKQMFSEKKPEESA